MSKHTLASLLTIGVALGATAHLWAQRPAAPACDPDNGGLTLAPGFCAKVIADDLGPARNIAVGANGDVYISLQTAPRVQGQPAQPGYLLALRDTDGDGTLDQREKFGRTGATGIVLHNGYVYFATPASIERFKLTPGQLAPTGTAEVVVGGFPEQRGHTDKDIAFDDKGNVYANIGLPSNACGNPDRQPGSKGMDPCPQLDNGGGVWKFSADAAGQTYSAKNRYATGMRQGVAVAWHDGHLYMAMNSRDSIDTMYPDLFSPADNQERPLEPLLQVNEGSTFGWPYCFFDGQMNKMILAPEYGGDGKTVGRCDKFEAPVATFPAHYAPVDLQFFTSNALPAHYRGGAFVVMHGSWNRAPAPMAGYNVLYQPFANGKPSGKYEVFADGFAGKGPIMNPNAAAARPNGIAIGPDGSLYITESVKGKTWRVFARAK